MRIPFPQSVSYTRSAILGAGLAALSMVQGTEPWIALLIFLFVILAATALNFSGGMSYPSGAYIASNAIVTLILPVVAKIFLGEPAQSRLRSPDRIFEIYVCGMVAMIGGALVSRTLRPQVSLLDRVAPIRDLRSAYYGAAFCALVITPLLFSGGVREDGSFASFWAQLDRFPVLTMLLGVGYTFKRTNGRRSLSTPLAIFIIFCSVTNGLVTFSKEAFLSPLFCWFLMLALMRFRLRFVHIAVFTFLSFIIYTYMVPYCSVGRNIDPDGRSGLEVAGYMISHIEEVRVQFEEDDADRHGYEYVSYYPRYIGLLNRMDVISGDSALAEVTDRLGPIGFSPAITALSNFVPHILWKNKPRGLYGNQYAHEIGELGKDDFSTGVSFSPSADAYHEGYFFGVLVFEMLVMSIGFTLLDSLAGDARRNFAVLVMLGLVVKVSHENALYGTINLCAQPMFALFFVALPCAYVFPIIGRFVNQSRARRIRGSVLEESAEAAHT